MDLEEILEEIFSEVGLDESDLNEGFNEVVFPTSFETIKPTQKKRITHLSYKEVFGK